MPFLFMLLSPYIQIRKQTNRDSSFTTKEEEEKNYALKPLQLRTRFPAVLQYDR